jgi:hypothetical protein
MQNQKDHGLHQQFIDSLIQDMTHYDLSHPRSISGQISWRSSNYSTSTIISTTTHQLHVSASWYRRQQGLSIHRATPHCLQAVRTRRGCIPGLEPFTISSPNFLCTLCSLESPWTHPPGLFLPHAHSIFFSRRSQQCCEVSPGAGVYRS